MKIPNDLYFSREHTWLRIENNIGTIGITDLAQGELGEIVYVDVPDAGYEFKQNEVFGSVEALKTVSDLFMPLSGKILETNGLLLQEPTLVNSEPYEKGWMIKIEIGDIQEIENLLTADRYADLIN